MLEAALASTGVLMFACSWAWSFWFWREMPRHPNIASGHTITETAHGATVYLNLIWHWLYRIFFWGGLIMFFSAALIDFYKDPFQRRVK
jgi:hypothetical protein